MGWDQGFDIPKELQDKYNRILGRTGKGRNKDGAQTLAQSGLNTQRGSSTDLLGQLKRKKRLNKKTS